MGVAFLSAMRSKDPSTQVGACIVNEENKIVGIGKFAESIMYIGNVSGKIGRAEVSVEIMI
jgi:deoxycytidylate deaminase